MGFQPGSDDAGANAFTDGSPGGWLSASTAVAFGAYAGLMAQEYGSQVTYRITENEPKVDSIAGYLGGFFPRVFPRGFEPYGDDVAGGVGLSDVLQNMIAGHAAAYKAIKAVEPTAKVSIAHNSIAFVPLSNNTADIQTDQRVQFLDDFLYLDSVTDGGFDTSLVGHRRAAPRSGPHRRLHRRELLRPGPGDSSPMAS